MCCFKIFYTLKTSTHIKINFKITPTAVGSTKPNSRGYTSTVEHGHNLTTHTSMLPQNHSVTY